MSAAGHRNCWHQRSKETHNETTASFEDGYVVGANDYSPLRVCGGIGETYDLDPTLFRLIVVFLCFATAIVPVALTYFIAWAIMPKEA